MPWFSVLNLRVLPYGHQVLKKSFLFANTSFSMNKLLIMYLKWFTQFTHNFQCITLIFVIQVLQESLWLG